MWSQALTIALVVASGIGGFITTPVGGGLAGSGARPLLCRGALRRRVRRRQARAERAGRNAARGRRRGRRADHARADRARRDPGRERSDHRPADRRGSAQRAAAHEPGDVEQRPRRSTAQAPRADGSLEALVSEGFAQAHGLKPGARAERADQRQAAHAGRSSARRCRPSSSSPACGACRTCAASASSGSTAMRWRRPTTWRGRSTAWRCGWRPARRSGRSVDACCALLAPYGGRDAHGRDDAGLARDARQRDQGAARARHGAAGDLPRRRRLPAQRGGVAPGRDAARADRRAEGARLRATRPSPRTT